MKQDINYGTNSKSQDKMNLMNVFNGIYKKLTRIKLKCGSPNTFLVQNTDKAPPGHSRSPGTGRRLISIGKLAGWKCGKSIYIIELQLFNNIQKLIITNI
jgi:hypothetical protein